MPTWLRRALPPGSHPLYLRIIRVFVGLFGVGYLWTGLAGRADPLFLVWLAGRSSRLRTPRR